MALEKLQTHDVFYCSGCKLEKILALPFNRSVYVSSSPFDLIHFDVPTFSCSHKSRVSILCFFLLMIILTIVGFLIKHRSEFLELYKAFRALVKTCYQQFCRYRHFAF